MVAFLSLAPRASLLAVSLMQPITMIFFPELVGGFHTKHSVQRAVMPCGTLRTQQRGWASGCYSRPAVSAVQFSSLARSQCQTMVPWTTPKLPHHVTHVARPRHLWGHKPSNLLHGLALSSAQSFKIETPCIFFRCRSGSHRLYHSCRRQ